MKKLLLILLCSPLLFSSCNNDKELQNDAIGKDVFDYRYENNLGNPETLKGTNNTYWITYYPQADITLLSRKKNDKILNAVSGKKPNLKQ
tara:strand:- start:618 stop:887 length:270 start_codon:yes stop_codon:yes gene_type:complete